ncbi:MAG: LacI family DNA-binding transcriptional regulator [Anaerolinea sp.]|nr:LacI family DNA-binding transcriptional regulator [Anaerolinea sp.]
MKNGLEDIAKLAGVSKSTVSRVINNQPNVNEKTRERVMEIIREVNFRPNKAARALVTQHTRVLSVVIPQPLAATFTDPYFPMLLQSITTAAAQRDYALMLWIGDNAEEEERFSERILSNSFFDGVLIASVVDNDPLVKRLRNAGFPYVLIGPAQKGITHYVDVDNRSAACDAVRHLIALKHQRIGIITGMMNMGAAQHRLQGYKDALEEAGMPIEEALIVAGDYEEVKSYSAMQTLITRGVDAVFCTSDVMALGALRAIADTGLRVPHDIGVVGFDGMPFAETSNPPLTTMRQPISLLGETATEMLIRLIEEQPLEHEHLLLPAVLEVRQSSGAFEHAG